MQLQCQPSLACEKTTTSSSSSTNGQQKRSRQYEGMSITRLESEEGEEDLEHTHICKKVSSHYATARNLLVSPKSIAKSSVSLSFEDLFSNFMRDMPLPDGSTERVDDEQTKNGNMFHELSTFLDSEGSLPANPNESGFWETLYIMEQESR